MKWTLGLILACACGRQNFNEPDAAVGIDAEVACVAPAACDSPVVYTCNGQCFASCADQIRRPSAATICEEWGGCLATIDSTADNNCAAAHLPATSWIGVQQDNSAPAPDAGWRQCDGAPIDYQRWGNGQPDDSNLNEEGDEQCATINPAGDWADSSCAMANAFVCSKPL